MDNTFYVEPDPADPVARELFPEMKKFASHDESDWWVSPRGAYFDELSGERFEIARGVSALCPMSESPGYPQGYVWSYTSAREWVRRYEDMIDEARRC